jgi:type IV pilus biogenesis protein CpaD/CtpE
VATLVVLVDPDGRGIVGGEDEGIVSFAEQWKLRGHGAMTVTVPRGTANEADAQAAISDF